MVLIIDGQEVTSSISVSSLHDTFQLLKANSISLLSRPVRLVSINLSFSFQKKFPEFFSLFTTIFIKAFEKKLLYTYYYDLSKTITFHYKNNLRSRLMKDVFMWDNVRWL